MVLLELGWLPSILEENDFVISIFLFLVTSEYYTCVMLKVLMPSLSVEQLYLIHILLGRNGYIHDPATIQLLLEISESLHDGIDLFNMKDNDNQQPARLISHFVQMVTSSNCGCVCLPCSNFWKVWLFMAFNLICCKVDYGIEMEHHLTFLVECRGAFSNIEELKVCFLLIFIFFSFSFFKMWKNDAH